MNKVKLNKIEESIVSAILLDTKSGMEKKLTMLERKAAFIKNNKSKQYVLESVKKIKTGINTVDFTALATNTLILKETTQQILEKEAPVYLIKYPDFPYIKKAKLEALDGDDTTETVFLTFKIPFYPKSKSYMEMRRELQVAGRKLSAFGHTVINKILRQNKQEGGQWPLFLGSGIWESSLPEFLNKKEVLGLVELAIDTTSPSMEALKPEVAKLLAVINETIPEFFGNIVSQTNTDNIELNQDNEKEEDSLVDENPTIEKEPSLADIKAAEKEFQLAEKTKKTKKKLA